MFKQLKSIINKPSVFESYTTDILWTKPHIAKNMLEAHLDQSHDAASRNKDFIKKSVCFIEDTFEISTGKAVIDFGCGPGFYTTAFAELGAKVRGIDFSKNSLDYANKIADENSLDISYEQCDYLKYKADRKYDLATLIYCDYCVLDLPKRKIFLKVIHDSLKEDGYFFFDVSSKFAFDQLDESQDFSYSETSGFFTENPHFTFTNKYIYPESLVGLTHFAIFEESETWNIYNWHQYFTLDSIKNELEQNGFIIESYYGNVAGEAFDSKCDVIALVCKKK